MGTCYIQACDYVYTYIYTYVHVYIHMYVLTYAKRAYASGASESARKRAVVYLKLGTRRTKENTQHRLETAHTTD